METKPIYAELQHMLNLADYFRHSGHPEKADELMFRINQHIALIAAHNVLDKLIKP